MASKNTLDFQPWCIAHRGFSSQYPENTFAAFDAALQTPIQAMELDIQLTRDSVPVVFHDPHMGALGFESEKIHLLDWRELQKRDFGGWFSPEFKGQPLVRLQQALGRYGSKCNLLLEVKCRERPMAGPRLRKLMRLVVEEVNRLNLRDTVWILCFDFELLSFGCSLDPKLRFVLNQKKPTQPKPGPFPHAYSISINGLTAEFVEQVHEQRKPVFTFTCNEDHQFKHARACVVDGIMSNDPRWLAGRIAESFPNQDLGFSPRLNLV